MSGWERVRARIESHDAAGTERLVLALSEQERRTVAKELPEYLRKLRAASEWGFLDRKVVVPLRLAGAGCLSGAAAVAGWLCRTDLRTWEEQGDWHSALIARMVAARPVEWRIDVARRMSARLRATNLPWQDGTTWRVAARLLRDAGAEPPVDDAFVLGWPQCRAQDTSLRDDPFLDTLLPYLFEVDGVGRMLAGAGPRWASELTALATDGRIEREPLLDGCLRRFLRGGAAVDLKWFVTLHDALDPTEQEVTTRTRDYLRLLPAAPGPVAELALREVRRADAAGALDEAGFAEAAEAALFRAEKKLVRAAITWLDRTARDRVDATLTALPVVFGNDAHDLRERAAKVVAKHAAGAGEQTLRAVRAAATELSPDLRDRVAASCGPVDAVEPAPAAAALVPVVPAELPAPITSPAELAEAVAALPRTFQIGWPEGERILAGLVRFAHQDPDGTRTALRRIPEVRPLDSDYAMSLEYLLLGAAWAATRPPRPVGRVRALLSRISTSARPKPAGSSTVWWRVLFRRIHEAIDAMGITPVLLATSTAGSGHVDPDVLVSRLERLESAAVEAGQTDLEQALLRLPREVDRDVVARAQRLSSPAGRAAARWLATGGLPEPKVTCEVLSRPRKDHWTWPHRDVDVARVMRTVSVDGASGTAADLCRLPRDGKRADPFGWWDADEIGWWPAMLPSHPEVVAAHLMPLLPTSTDNKIGQGAIVLALAQADGPAGAATATVLAYALGARHQEERAGGVDALLTLIARDRLRTAELGTALGTLVRHDYLKLNRVTAALNDAANAGAGADVWSLITAILPAVLPDEGTRAPSGLPDLIALGTTWAQAVDARAGIPRLAVVAARGGSSRLVKEAARLHRQISPA